MACRGGETCYHLLTTGNKLTFVESESQLSLPCTQPVLCAGCTRSPAAAQHSGLVWPCQEKLSGLFGEEKLDFLHWFLCEASMKEETLPVYFPVQGLRKSFLKKQAVLLIFWNLADLYHLFCREESLLEQEIQELNSSSSILFFFLNCYYAFSSCVKCLVKWNLNLLALQAPLTR